jgi:hypothetical protein
VRRRITHSVAQILAAPMELVRDHRSHTVLARVLRQGFEMGALCVGPFPPFPCVTNVTGTRDWPSRRSTLRRHGCRQRLRSAAANACELPPQPACV